MQSMYGQFNQKEHLHAVLSSFDSELFHFLSGTDRYFLVEVEKALREAQEASQTLKAHW